MRILGIIGFLLAGLTVASGQVPSSSFPVPNTSVSPSGSLPFTPQQVFNVGDYGAVGNGSTDDTVAINAALTACSTQGGGQVVFAYKQYLVNTANLTVPQGCVLGNKQWVGDERIGSPTNNMKTVPAILLNPTYTITMNYGSGIDGLAIFQSTLSAPTSLRTAIQGVAAFTGTAITAASTASSTSVNNVYIVGFNQCISNLAPRMHVGKLRADCINGIKQNNTNALSVIDDVEFWQFYSQNNGFGDPTDYAITGVVASGSNIQVTIGAGSAIIANDTVSIRGVGGYTGANNRWVVTSIDGSGNIILTGSQSAPSTTGTWSSGAKAIAVASVNSLAVGQGVTGTNIAGSSTVSYVDYNAKTIYLNNATTGAGAGTTLTFSNSTYTGATGTLRLSADIRAGHGLDISQAAEVKVSHFLDEEHDIGAYLLGSTNPQGTYWATLVSFSCDVTPSPFDPGTTCVYATAPDTSNVVMGLVWIGGYTSSVDQSFYFDSKNAVATSAVNLISGVHFGSNATTLMAGSIQSGTVTIASSDLNAAGTSGNSGIAIADGVSYVAFNGNAFSKVNLLLNTATGQGKVYVDSGTQIGSTGGAYAYFNPPNDSGLNSIGVGRGALANLAASAAYHNTCFGDASCAGAMSTAAIRNTGFGYQALNGVTTGSDNDAFGERAGLGITTGAQNTCFGTISCSAMVGGNTNAAFGYNTLPAATGSGNTVIGGNAGATITSGGRNTLLGVNVGSTTLTTGGNNILIGTASNCTTVGSGDNDTFQICASSGSTPLISGSLVAASLTLTMNPVTINMPNIASSSAAQTGTVCRGTAGLLTYDTTTTCLLSSMTVKHDWHTLKGALSEVMALNPVDFLYNDQETVPGRQIGFLAEEVALVDPRLVATGADRPPGVRYTQITALLAAAIQEQEARLAAIEARLH